MSPPPPPTLQHLFVWLFIFISVDVHPYSTPHQLSRYLNKDMPHTAQCSGSQSGGQGAIAISIFIFHLSHSQDFLSFCLINDKNLSYKYKLQVLKKEL